MHAWTSHGGGALELVLSAQTPLFSVLVTLVVVMMALGVWGQMTTLRRERQHLPEPARTLSARLYLRRSRAWRRGWTTESRGFGRPVSAREGAAGPAPPSPAIRRLRTRRAIRHLARDWAVVRYPY